MNINHAFVSAADEETGRAVDAWQRISEKPTSIALKRDDGTAVAAQTVRVEWSSTSGGGSGEKTGPGGASSVRYGTLFGVLNHPFEDDTDIRRGDRFALNGYQYKIVDVLVTLGELQGRFEAMG